MIDPYFPLIMSTNNDHVVLRLKDTEDIDQYFITHHHLLQEIDDLRQSQLFYITQTIFYLLHWHAQIERTAPRMLFNVLQGLDYAILTVY
jgi:hypothetical protein